MIRRFYDKLVEFYFKIPTDKRLHFAAGFFIAVLFAILLGWKWCIIPAVIAGVLKEVFDYYTTKSPDVWDAVATALGGVIVQVMVLFSPLF